MKPFYFSTFIPLIPKLKWHGHVFPIDLQMKHNYCRYSLIKKIDFEGHNWIQYYVNFVLKWSIKTLFCTQIYRYQLNEEIWKDKIEI